MAEKLPRYLTGDQIDKLLALPFKAKVPHPWRDLAILQITYSCGLRIAEVSALKREDIFWDDKLIRVTGKGSRERMVKIRSLALFYLGRYMTLERSLLVKADSPFVFVNHRGERLSTGSVGQTIRYYLNSPEFPKTNGHLTPHSLRHTFACDLLNNGCDLNAIQAMLGHSRLETTKIYAKARQPWVEQQYERYFPGGGR